MRREIANLTFSLPLSATPDKRKALADSLKVEISVIAAESNDHILIFLGNFGKKFVEEELDLLTNPGVMCSNFIDVALDSSVEHGFKKILLVGHIGKLVKLGIGMFNTHSRNGDGRIEALLSCALEGGADLETLKEIQKCVTTNAVLDILYENDLLDKTMLILKGRIGHNIERRIPDEIQWHQCDCSVRGSVRCTGYRRQYPHMGQLPWRADGGCSNRYGRYWPAGCDCHSL